MAHAEAKLSKNELARVVDEYGMLKAQAADLAAKLETVKEMLLESGEKEIDGILFRVTVSDSERQTLDSKALKAQHPTIYATFLRTTSVTTVRCNSR
jgi:hypothetical protein